MLETKAPWQEFEISPDGTHHTLYQKPAYPTRFLSVLKFHLPGLAPVKDSSGAFHIYSDGQAVYPFRFLQTFGFYENRAAVQSPSGWYHISPDGLELYQSRFAWCGNYQQGYSTVRDFKGAFFHIDHEGKRAYSQQFLYAGDFHDGYATIQNADGLYTHIDFQGNYLHGKWFIDLDTYHKGFARAKDTKGWFHIDLKGLPAYAERYENVEPFYNGIARVETDLGSILRITEQGEQVETLRKETRDTFHEVSAELVSYWRFYTLQAANQLGLFDSLPNSACEIARNIGLEKAPTTQLLYALQEMGFVTQGKDHLWNCTEKGRFLRSDHPYSLKAACNLWKEEHLTCWREILYSLKTNRPAFNHLFGKGWFDWLKDHPDKKALYHTALSVYSQRDYHAFCSSVDLTHHRSLVDIGGSTGKLLVDILTHNPHIKGFLLDLPEVLQLVEVPSHLQSRLQHIPLDFFQNWPSLTVDSAVLSRVLHDWPDQEVLEILQKTRSLLSDHPDCRLYIIENIQEKENCALLNLNMSIMTGGVERTLEEFRHLLNKAGFALERTVSLNSVSSILIAKVLP